MMDLLIKLIQVFTGILVNGVEVLNYKSKDVVRYGKIEDIEIIAPGEKH
jgi:hypothetical protein